MCASFCVRELRVRLCQMQEQALAEIQAAFISDVAQLRTGTRTKLGTLLALSDVILSYADGMLSAT